MAKIRHKAILYKYEILGQFSPLGEKRAEFRKVLIIFIGELLKEHKYQISWRSWRSGQKWSGESGE